MTVSTSAILTGPEWLAKSREGTLPCEGGGGKQCAGAALQMFVRGRHPRVLGSADHGALRGRSDKCNARYALERIIAQLSEMGREEGEGELGAMQPREWAARVSGSLAPSRALRRSAL